MELLGKVAVITGGGIRVGQALTLRLAEAGCDVFIHYGRSEKQAEETKAMAEKLGVSAHIHKADLKDVGATRSVIPAALEHFGRVDILINNAAIFLDGDISSTTLDMWDSQFAINLQAPFLLSQAFAAQIPLGDRGVIINITDARVFRPAADHFAYRLTKSALVAMTEGLAHDLAPRIRVNAVALGAILPPPDKSTSHLDGLAKTHIPLGRVGNPAIVADNVLHLIEQEFLTGVIVRIDGAQFL